MDIDPDQPETMPSGTAITNAAETTKRLNRMLTLAPSSRRLRTSRPRSSVPSQCALERPANGGPASCWRGL